VGVDLIHQAHAGNHPRQERRLGASMVTIDEKSAKNTEECGLPRREASDEWHGKLAGAIANAKFFSIPPPQP